MKKYTLSLLLLSTTAWANLHLAPPDFDLPGEQRAVFVDFKNADYDITYDMAKKTVTVKSRIEFESKALGQPVFDLVPDPSKVRIDGVEITATSTVAPDGSQIRVTSGVVPAGKHVLEVENTFKKNVRFNLFSKGVSSAFWIRDLKGRMFLEQYVPSNFEYDQYKMGMTVTFKGLGTKKKQEIFANGKVTEVKENSYRIEYPEYFTVSCPYFHTTPKGKLRRLDFTYESISGDIIPMTVYTPWYLKTSKFKKYTLEVMDELERDYGAWAHPQFIAYGTLPGMGGMEHAGATQTSLSALDHEMLHSYFAKGVMPANGNSGWIDEAIASWRDYGYQRLPDPGFVSSGIARHSAYKRNTDDRSYELGRGFMAYLDYRLQDTGGLKAFLRGYFAAYKHTVITTEHFKNNIEFFSGLDLTSEFNTYVWGEDMPEEDSKISHNPKHIPLTDAQLESLL